MENLACTSTVQKEQNPGKETEEGKLELEVVSTNNRKNLNLIVPSLNKIK